MESIQLVGKRLFPQGTGFRYAISLADGSTPNAAIIAACSYTDKSGTRKDCAIINGLPTILRFDTCEETINLSTYEKDGELRIGSDRTAYAVDLINARNSVKRDAAIFGVTKEQIFTMKYSGSATVATAATAVKAPVAKTEFNGDFTDPAWTKAGIRVEFDENDKEEYQAWNELVNNHESPNLKFERSKSLAGFYSENLELALA